MDPLACSICKSDGALLVCSRCKAVRYCGESCQRTDWLRHKVDCKKIMRRLQENLSASAEFSPERDARAAFLAASVLSKLPGYRGDVPVLDTSELAAPRAARVPGGRPLQAGWGACPNWKAAAGYSIPLVRAVHQCDIRVAQALLTDGADVHARAIETGHSPLHAVAVLSSPYVSKEGSLAAVKEMCILLLDAGADPDAQCILGNTPLETIVAGIRSSIAMPQLRRPAFVRHLTDVTRLLINAGASLKDARGDWLLNELADCQAEVRALLPDFFSLMMGMHV